MSTYESKEIPLKDDSGDSISLNKKMKFIIPSLMGVILFMVPISSNGTLTVPIAKLIDIINSNIESYMLVVSLVVAVLPSILTLIVNVTPSLKQENNRFVQLFNPGLKWTVIRILGAVMMIMVYYKVGPEWIWNKYTGGILLYEVAPVILAMYVVTALLLPLLTNYGLMEFIGRLISKPFSMAFRLPGRAAVDSLASWLSATSLGIIVTTEQYKTGFYTKREAASIATSFSIVSIAFSYVMLKFVNMEHTFVYWYFSVAITGIVCAIIVPRIPPINQIEHTYYKSNNQNLVIGERKEGENLFSWAFRSGIERAEKAEPLHKQFLNGTYTAVDLIITIYPAMMLFGVIGLAFIEYTSVMDYVSMPLVPVLELLGLPEAKQAALAISTGFIDLLMPVILGADIESELTRFVIAGVTVNGIIFLSEVAIIMMRADIGLNLLRLFIIWLVRLAISLPILTLLGNVFL